MTTGPTDVKVTTAAGGPDGMPLALKLNEGLDIAVLKPCDIEVTAAMIEAGFAVLAKDRPEDDLLWADELLVEEIFRAMDSARQAQPDEKAR